MLLIYILSSFLALLCVYIIISLLLYTFKYKKTLTVKYIQFYYCGLIRLKKGYKEFKRYYVYV